MREISATKSKEATPFERFQDVMKSILNVSKEEVEKLEQKSKEDMEKSGKKRHSLPIKSS